MRVIHLEISGRVQGVGFRWFVRERAHALGIAGWVRNHADGTVEVVAKGREHAVEAFLTELRVGPPGALVREIREQAPLSQVEYPEPFTVKR